MKRVLDVILALFLLLPTLPILVLASVAIRVDTPGSPLFWQKRVGRGEEGFWMLKLRTMAVGTEDRASHEIGPARITKVGRFLRKTKIDELPQILSVIAGDMSFVGPRPCLFVQTELISERRCRDVFAVRPGITGLAQVAGVDMSDPVRLALIDADYIKNRTFLGDLRLILATFFGGGSGDAAFKDRW